MAHSHSVRVDDAQAVTLRDGVLGGVDEATGEHGPAYEDDVVVRWPVGIVVAIVAVAHCEGSIASRGSLQGDDERLRETRVVQECL